MVLCSTYLGAAVVESKRTLNRIIRDDLGFDASLLKFAGREFRDQHLSLEDKQAIDRLAKRLEAQRSKAIRELSQDVDAAVEQMSVIEPSKTVVTKTLELYQVKSLPPFDEMIMGAVLVTAEELLGSGERNCYFCNKNKKDFAPDKSPSLAAEYERLTITYLPDFKVRE